MATTFKANRERNLTPKGNSRTITMRETRRFDNEIDAVNQLIAWQKDMETNGWALAFNFGKDYIRMKRVNGACTTGTAMLYVSI